MKHSLFYLLTGQLTKSIVYREAGRPPSVPLQTLDYFNVNKVVVVTVKVLKLLNVNMTQSWKKKTYAAQT